MQGRRPARARRRLCRVRQAQLHPVHFFRVNYDRPRHRAQHVDVGGQAAAQVRRPGAWTRQSENVAVPGPQADAGTHVASTRQIGGLEVVKIENKGKGFRRLRVRVTPA